MNLKTLFNDVHIKHLPFNNILFHCTKNQPRIHKIREPKEIVAGPAAGPLDKFFTKTLLFVLKLEIQNNSFDLSFDLLGFTNLCILG